MSLTPTSSYPNVLPLYAMPAGNRAQAGNPLACRQWHANWCGGCGTSIGACMDGFHSEAPLPLFHPTRVVD